MRQENQTGLQTKGLLGDGAFQGSFDMLHGLEGDKTLLALALAALQPSIEFLTAFIVDHEQGAIRDL